MKLVIQTQYKENYAAHNEDYVQGVSVDHWKFKGGSTYVVENITPAQARNIEMDGIPHLTALIEERNESFEEYILDHDIVADDATEWRADLLRPQVPPPARVVGEPLYRAFGLQFRRFVVVFGVTFHL